MQFKETKVNFNLVCSKDYRVGLDLAKGIKFYLKEVCCPVLALGIMKEKCFPSRPSRVWEIKEKELYTFANSTTGIGFDDMNHT